MGIINKKKVNLRFLLNIFLELEKKKFVDDPRKLIHHRMHPNASLSTSKILGASVLSKGNYFTA